MKNLYLVVVLLLSFVSCDKNEKTDPTPDPDPTLELSTLSLDFESAKHTKTITVKSMSSEKLDISVDSEGVSWCNTFFDNKEISVSVTENDGADVRETNITIICDGLSKKVKVRQLGLNKVILVDPESFSLESVASEISFKITANVDYEISIPEWIEKEPETRMESKDYIYYVDSNNEKARTGKILIKEIGGTTQNKITISQKSDNFQLKVLGLNVWGDGNVFTNSFQGLIDIIDQTDSDVVLLQEIRSQGTINTLIDSLKKKGKTYYGKSLTISSALLSKYPLADIQSSTELGSDSYAFTKGTINIKGQQITVYSVHLDWLYVGYYLGRGYCGQTWEKLEEPVLDVDSLLIYTGFSRRKEEVRALIASMQKESDKGNLVIFAGDLNEPSHFDWQEDTKDIRDHGGMVINWECSMLLQHAGYKDAYREMYPNPVTHPGFTCNAGNKDADPDDLEWSLGIDDRERIDFLYYLPNKKLQLTEIAVVGPKEDFYDGRIQFQQTEDNIIEPKGIWPSDHKGVYAEFELEKDRSVIIPGFGEGNSW